MSEIQPMEIEDLSHTIHFADGMDNEAPSAGTADRNSNPVNAYPVSSTSTSDNKFKAPSATVDEPKHLSTEQRQLIFNFFYDKEVVLMDDDLNQIENIVYPRIYPYTLKGK